MIMNARVPRWMAEVGLVVLLSLVGCGPSGQVECEDGEFSCAGACTDLAWDSENCGACGVECLVGEGCENGLCVPGAGACEPGATAACYSGPDGTENIGPCVGGMRTCQPGGTWGPCQGEITPVSEDCSNAIDDDCNGVVDDEADGDGDGWTNCQGDCCDAAGTGCASPELVNPGAFEAAGNEVDDDCDGIVDNPLAACDNGLASNSGNAMDYAVAMDLCQNTVENPTPEQRRWGVISAELTLADGGGSPANSSRAIRPAFGATETQFGSAMAVLSTGHAAASGQSNPGFAEFQPGEDMFTSSAMPADWLAANGGTVPNAPGCPPADGNSANDVVMLNLRVRVPTNAKSFSLSANFLSAEYSEWVCSPFNDFFVVLLDSGFVGQPANPADKNLARYTAPDDSVYPVGVNLAYGNTGLFQQCENGPSGCGFGSTPGNVASCVGTSELGGTGFDPPLGPFDLDACGNNDRVGGGTGWLVTSGNVVPGEIIDLRFAIWDTSDHAYDSVVLLDNFQWSVEASDPGTVIIE